MPVVDHVDAGHRRGGQDDRLRAQVQPDDRHRPADKRARQYIAISSRCAHLGCPVRWVDAAERFICPCHGGVYDLLGRRVGGPPVRPLDRFYTRVRDGQVRSARASASTASCAASPRATPASRSTASASTSTRRGPTRRNSYELRPSAMPKPKLPAPPLPPADCRRRRGPGEAERQAGPLEEAKEARHRTSSTGSTSAPR